MLAPFAIFSTESKLKSTCFCKWNWCKSCCLAVGKQAYTQNVCYSDLASF